MRKIGDGLIARSKRKALRHQARAEPGKLGKNEPHPVTLLLTTTQFANHARIDRRLRIDKALELERIAHARLLSTRPASSASLSSSGRWLSRILAWAAARSNHCARSISGKSCTLPIPLRHSISKLLLLMAPTSRSPSTATP